MDSAAQSHQDNQVNNTDRIPPTATTDGMPMNFDRRGMPTYSVTDMQRDIYDMT